ncbi:transposase [Microbulbifer sp. ZKSA004]
MQLLYNLSDPAMEDTLYEIEAMRCFAGLTLTKPIPDKTIILKFHRLLEAHLLGRQIFKEINKHRKGMGILLKEGCIVDATIISAPKPQQNSRKYSRSRTATERVLHGKENREGLKERKMDWYMAMKQSKLKTHPGQGAPGKAKAQISAKVEHPYR